MRMLEKICREFGSGRLAGKNVLLCTHATEATTELVRTLLHMGARVFYIPIVYSFNASHVSVIGDLDGCDVITYDEIPEVMPKIDAVMEDGMRISAAYDGKWHVKQGAFGIEQTTNGIFRFDGMHGDGPPWPVINVADSALKRGVENSMATPESILSALVNEKSISLTRKNVLVLGYGSVGGGVAEICRAHGSNVSITDSDPAKGVLASARGFRSFGLTDMNKILPWQDLIISCTPDGDGSCLGVEQFLIMKDGAVVLNAGSGRGEISGLMCAPASHALNRAEIDITSVGDDLVCKMSKAGECKTVTILCSAHPVNLRLSGGTPSDAIDLVFSLMVVALVKTRPDTLSAGVNRLDADVEKYVSRLLEEKQRPPAIQPSLHKSEDMADEYRPWGGLRRFGPGYLESFSVVRATFKPDTTTDGHYHLTSDEAYVVLGGGAVIMTWEPGDPSAASKYKVEVGDYLMIPGGIAHRVFVTSEDDFVCLVVASPPFSPWDQFFPRAPKLQLSRRPPKDKE